MPITQATVQLCRFIESFKLHNRYTFILVKINLASETPAKPSDRQEKYN
ncbi:hypothetical protein N436_02641 [Pseudomonas sp. RV120224-01b]|nr:hypothetical protein N428_02829 [Pseudomonas sp. RV120224-01c]PYG82647.1 hypothetical protein N436_02641 [Pseudomonas sp. RV120224-01b]